MVNMNPLSRLIFCSLIILLSPMVFSQALKVEPQSVFHHDVSTKILSANISELRTMLLGEQQSIIVALPLPNGGLG